MMNASLRQVGCAFVEGLADPAVLLDAALRPVEVNSRFARYARRRSRELREALAAGEPILDMLAPPGGHDLSAARAALRRGRAVNLAEVVVRNASGDSFTVMLSFIPLPGPGGGAEALVVLFRDVSAEARVQRRYKVLLQREAARARELEDRVAERTAQLEDALAQLTIVSQTDPLTGLLNRRAFDARAAALWAQLQRAGRSLGLLLCDLDHFKQVNDVHGHPAGDQVLTAVANALLDAVRATDTVARFGGEEFIILLPGAAATAAEEVARRCVERVRAIDVATLVPGYDGPQTLSVGVAVAPAHARSLAQLIARADAALYEAKRRGRDRAVVCEDDAGADSARWHAAGPTTD